VREHALGPTASLPSEEARQGLAAGADAACASTTFCSLAERLRDVGVDRETRGKEGASDHVPVWVELRDKPKRRTDIVCSESSRAAPAATTAASPEKASWPFAVTFPISDNR
jgi:hypothetical protein